MGWKPGDNTKQTPTRRAVLGTALTASVGVSVGAGMGMAALARPARTAPALYGDQLGFPLVTSHPSANSQGANPQAANNWLLAVSSTWPLPPLSITTSTPLSGPSGNASVHGPVRDPGTGLICARISLPDLPGPGQITAALGQSEPVEVLISDGLWTGLLGLSLRAFYLQRCGVALNDGVTGLRRRSCHTGDGAHTDDTGKTHSGDGGWHTGHDYEKDTLDTAYCIGMILGAVDASGTVAGADHSRIPESGNGRADVLDEMMVGLDWLLRVQDSQGGVSGGIKAEGNPGTVMPQDDTTPRRFAPVTAAATASACAALALGARVLSATAKMRTSLNPASLQQANKYRNGALRAWARLETLLTDAPDAGPAPWSAHLWALGEMALLTEEPRLQRAFAAKAVTAEIMPPTPLEPGSLALIHTIRTKADDLARLRGTIINRLTTWADDAATRSLLSPYGLVHSGFGPRSTMQACAAGMLLWEAHRFSGHQDHLRVALDQLHFVLGRNPAGRAFVTGLDRRGVRHPAHLESTASGVIFPGLMVSGPNAADHDPHTPKNLGALSYADHRDATASNGVSLAGTAALAALLMRLSSDAQ